MKPVLDRAKLRMLDRLATEEYGIPSLLLMENAGLGLTHCCLDILAALESHDGAAVSIVCGRGNNGGDGLVLARHLANHGHQPRVLMVGEGPAELRSPDARTNLDIAERMGLDLRWAEEPSALEEALAAPGALLVDAFLGTGPAQRLRSDAVTVIEVMNACRAPRLAVDLPSGLDCDRGEPLGAAVVARWTVTMAAFKPGFSTPGAASYTGVVRRVGIGAPRALLERLAGPTTDA